MATRGPLEAGIVSCVCPSQPESRDTGWCLTKRDHSFRKATATSCSFRATSAITRIHGSAETGILGHVSGLPSFLSALIPTQERLFPSIISATTAPTRRPPHNGRARGRADNSAVTEGKQTDRRDSTTEPRRNEAETGTHQYHLAEDKAMSSRA
ncbi:hypothetical protein LSAT2_017162 [Lamellibrachia satsuma]|nr:hypothetical protein LSAT2_017162 [Lamellibrachia satsuma]